MVNVMGIASELGYLHIPDGVLIDLNLINRYEPGQLVLITTGSQGEPMSALTRMALPTTARWPSTPTTSSSSPPGPSPATKRPWAPCG